MGNSITGSAAPREQATIIWGANNKLTESASSDNLWEYLYAGEHLLSSASEWQSSEGIKY